MKRDQIWKAVAGLTVLALGGAAALAAQARGRSGSEPAPPPAMSSTALAPVPAGSIQTTSPAVSSAGALPPTSIHVPFVAAPIHIDAEMEGKSVWSSDAGSTQNFRDADGKGMVPYTEVRARWGSGKLYFWMYAGDLDLEGAVKTPDGDISKDDSFHLELGSPGHVHVVEVSVLGTIADAVCTGSSDAQVDLASAHCDRRWQSNAVAAVDVDGTLNRTGDNDEEWLVEMAIPLKDLELTNAAPGTRIPFLVRRCEIERDGPHQCGAWGAGVRRGELILDR